MYEPTLREHVDALQSRLLRIGAAAQTLRALDGGAPRALVDVLETLDRDLLLAAHELDATQALAMRQLEPRVGEPT